MIPFTHDEIERHLDFAYAEVVKRYGENLSPDMRHRKALNYVDHRLNALKRILYAHVDAKWQREKAPQ